MQISKELKQLLDAPSVADFENAFMDSFCEDAKKRNPDVATEKMIVQLARPKYNDGIKSINKELESLKIINRRTDAK